MENEIWKDIIGYENLYQCSNLGRIKSLGNGDSNVSKERILKLTKRKDGYYQIGLHKESKLKMYLVHRLIGQAFIPNPNNYPQINHKNEQKTDNCVSNLEWVTQKYNINYGTHNERSGKAISISQKGRKLSQETKEKIGKAISIAKKGKKQSQEHISNKAKARQKPIIQLTLNGEFIKYWKSAKQASEILGINASNFTQCCKGKYKSCRGFKWKYLSDYINEQIQYFNALKEYRNRLNDILKKVS